MKPNQYDKIEAWIFWLTVSLSMVNVVFAIFCVNSMALLGWLCTVLWVLNTRTAQKERDSYKRLCDRLLEQSANPNTRPQGRTATRNAEGRQPERRRKF